MGLQKITNNTMNVRLMQSAELILSNISWWFYISKHNGKHLHQKLVSAFNYKELRQPSINKLISCEKVHFLIPTAKCLLSNTLTIQ